MRCHTPHPSPPAGNAARHGPADRAGDADRERTLDVLGDAHARGYLGDAELDERLSAALTARTHGDLAALVADLPPQLLAEHRRRESVDAARRLARAGLPRHVATYVAVMTLLVGIWLAVGVSGGGWYPWPVWPALGWGVGVVGHARAAYRRPQLTAAG